MAVGERWFDHNCSAAHRRLTRALKSEPQDKVAITALRKNYKLTLAARKKEIKTDAWNELLSVNVIKNSSKFWEIVNKPFFQNTTVSPLECNIQEQLWFNHFKTVYGNLETQGDRDPL